MDITMCCVASGEAKRGGSEQTGQARFVPSHSGADQQALATIIRQLQKNRNSSRFRVEAVYSLQTYRNSYLGLGCEIALSGHGQRWAKCTNLVLE